MHNKIGAVVVIYNQLLTDSKTLRSITSDPFNEILIVDNSDDKFGSQNQEIATEFNYDYYSANQNIGLSKAYNYAFEFFKTKDIDHIVLLDDDTQLTDEYCQLLKTFDFKNNVIYAPLIKHNNVLVNPSYYANNPILTMFKGRKYRNTTDIYKLVKTKHLYAINTGLIIPRNIFSNFKYDENLFLDCVDHYFCQKIYESGYYIDILPTMIIQSYDNEEAKNRSYEENIHRLKIRLTDLKTFNKQYYFLNKCLILIPLYLASKDTRYLKLLIEEKSID